MTGRWQERFLDTSDGVRIRAARAGPATARGSFFVLPGRGEFIEKYAEVVDDLAARGFASVVIDWRGQGLSARLHGDPQRFHARDFADYLLDLGAVVDAFADALPHPHLIFAYSMGAHVALRWLHDHRRDARIHAAVLISPMIDLPFGPRGRMGVRLLGAAIGAVGQKHRYLPKYGPYDAQKRWSDMPVLTSDRPRFARLLELAAERPELTVGGPTYGWLGAALASADLIRKPGYPEAIPTPCLAVEAARDIVIAREAIAPYAARMPNAQHVVIEEAQHELLLETDAIRGRFFEAFDGFVDRMVLPA